jgi:hypothetical protein
MQTHRDSKLSEIFWAPAVLIGCFGMIVSEIAVFYESTDERWVESVEASSYK